MRISRIANPCALYGASVSAQTFDSMDDAIINPIDFDAIAESHLEKAMATITHPHIPGFDEFSRKFARM